LGLSDVNIDDVHVKANPRVQSNFFNECCFAVTCRRCCHEARMLIFEWAADGGGETAMAAKKTLAAGFVRLALLGAALCATPAVRAGGALDLCRTGNGEAQIAACAAVGADSSLPLAARVEALLRHSSLVRRTGDDELAQKALEAAEEIDPRNGEIAIAFAKFHYDNARYDEAEKHIMQAQALLPNRPEPHNIMGKIWMMRDELDKAIKEFRTAIAIDPSHANSRLNCANAYYKQGRFSEALEQYTIAVQLYPEGVQRTNALTMEAITRQKLAAGQ
jgi:tetratricopeptide (TPR) repeat protein